MSVWIVNDYLTCIPGTKTFWHDLIEWIDDAEAVCGVPFEHLATMVEHKPGKPDLIIRNGTYFRSINMDVPCISLIQDIQSHNARDIQLDVCFKSSATVFNSEYTRSFYPEIGNSVMVPLGVDFDFFYNDECIDNRWPRICFIGSSNEIKGFSTFVDLVDMYDSIKFVYISKDGSTVERSNVENHSRLDQIGVRGVIRSCNIGLCLSTHETQHLAGIEMGACGLPMIATNVGAYYELPDGEWGRRFLGLENFGGIVSDILDYNLNPRDFWLSRGMDKESCRSAWLKLVDEKRSK